jgi:hypothetical protein
MRCAFSAVSQHGTSPLAFAVLPCYLLTDPAHKRVVQGVGKGARRSTKKKAAADAGADESWSTGSESGDDEDPSTEEA